LSPKEFEPFLHPAFEDEVLVGGILGLLQHNFNDVLKLRIEDYSIDKVSFHSQVAS
jgi:hypothetical protein